MIDSKSSTGLLRVTTKGEGSGGKSRVGQRTRVHRVEKPHIRVIEMTRERRWGNASRKVKVEGKGPREIGAKKSKKKSNLGNAGGTFPLRVTSKKTEWNGKTGGKKNV